MGGGLWGEGEGGRKLKGRQTQPQICRPSYPAIERSFALVVVLLFGQCHEPGERLGQLPSPRPILCAEPIDLGQQIRLDLPQCGHGLGLLCTAFLVALQNTEEVGMGRSRHGAAPEELVGQGPGHDWAVGPNDPRLVLRVELLPAHRVGRIDLVLRQELAGRKLQNIQPTRDLGANDEPVVPVGGPLPASEEALI
jgi:hypothetical protein